MQHDLEPDGPDARRARLISRLISTVAVILLIAAVGTFFVPLLKPKWERLIESGDWHRWAPAAGIALLVIMIPVWMLRRVWRRPRADMTPAEPAPAPVGERLRRRKRREATPKGCIVGPAIFLVVGLGFLAVFTLPAIKTVEARSWDAVDCEILASSVATHSGDDGATYSVEVTYRYRVDGLEYTGSRYRFLGGSSSGYAGKKKVVDSLPPGSVTTCWVDPEDPTQSVLDRGLSWEYLFALLPLVFVALGAGGLVLALRTYWISRRKRLDLETGLEAAVGSFKVREDEGVLPAAPAGEQVLEPAASPIGKLVGITVAAVFWNGIVGIFVWLMWRQPDAFLGCFLVPFVLIGLLLLTGIPYQALALANPKPRLRLAEGRLRPGGSTTFYWSFTGATRRLRNLRIDLEGREEATHRSGDSSNTSGATFARIQLVDMTESGLMPQGNASVEVPAQAMHSFKGRRNRITWLITVRCAIARWPDVNEEFEVIVVPEILS